MQRLRAHLTYANVMSTLAVILAIAGGSTAIAVTVSAGKKSDVNKKGKIRGGHVTTPKLANAAVSAAKLGGIDVVQATAPADAKASCPPTERLLAGGGDIPSGGMGALQISRPYGNGWEAVINAGSGSPGVVAYALCLR